MDLLLVVLLRIILLVIRAACSTTLSMSLGTSTARPRFHGTSLGRSPDVDGELCDVERPILGSNFRICLNTITIGLVNRIGMVFARLDRLVLELLGDLRD